MWTAGSTASAPVEIGIIGGRCRQPPVVCALQRAASITDTSLPSWLTVYSVWVRGSRVKISGSDPVWMAGGWRFAQPAGLLPLQTLVSTIIAESSF